jgi:hypothetical protein
MPVTRLSNPPGFPLWRIGDGSGAEGRSGGILSRIVFESLIRGEADGDIVDGVARRARAAFLRR